MSHFPEQIDPLGQGQITPDNEFVVDLIAAIEADRQLYIDAAVKASGKPAVEGNARVLEYLAAVGLDQRVIEMDDPNRTYLLDALREMGIRLRRLADVGLNGAGGDDVFGQFLEGILTTEGTTW